MGASSELTRSDVIQRSGNETKEQPLEEVTDGRGDHRPEQAPNGIEEGDDALGAPLEEVRDRPPEATHVQEAGDRPEERIDQRPDVRKQPPDEHAHDRADECGKHEVSSQLLAKYIPLLSPSQEIVQEPPGEDARRVETPEGGGVVVYTTDPFEVERGAQADMAANPRTETLQVGPGQPRKGGAEERRDEPGKYELPVDFAGLLHGDSSE